jgi:hypothetical protein
MSSAVDLGPSLAASRRLRPRSASRDSLSLALRVDNRFNTIKIANAIKASFP